VLSRWLLIPPTVACAAAQFLFREATTGAEELITVITEAGAVGMDPVVGIGSASPERLPHLLIGKRASEELSRTSQALL
jgi:hypothetical protein